MDLPPLTVTASIWNYCQNRCFYCVAGSNAPTWKFGGRFEVFFPPGAEGMNDLEMRIAYGADYYQRLNTDPTLLNAKDVLRFDYLAHWIRKNAPGAALHLSGGEPLLRPDIEAGAALLVAAGIDLSILTNGILIPNRPALLELPIRWHVTHHAAQPLDRFLAAVEPIKSRPHVLTRLWVGPRIARQRAALERAYSGFNFRWKGCGRPRAGDAPPGAPGCERVATDLLHFITPDGRIWPCNNMSWGELGNVYAGTYDLTIARRVNLHARRCILAGHCGAYVTAFQMAALKP